MQLARPTFAPDPRQFGKRGEKAVQEARFEKTLSEDVKLFVLTFAAGFLFVSILIG